MSLPSPTVRRPAVERSHSGIVSTMPVRRRFTAAARVCAVLWLTTLWLMASTFGTCSAEELSSQADDEATLVAMAEVLDAAEVPPAPTEGERLSLVGDELWFVSSRGARCSGEGAEGLHYWKYDGTGSWLASTLDELAAADPRVPTCFHVHGNRVALGQANFGGWKFYRALTEDCGPRKPLRFVIFSWPSDRLCGPQRDDLRTKAVLAECHAYHLAYVVDRLPVEWQISMIGYSYGARLVGGTLHLLGGGTLCGRNLPDQTGDEPRQVRAVLLAAAMDSVCFLPGCSFDEAPTQIDRLLVVRNAADRVLKWYPLLYKLMLRPTRGVQAMGYAGVAGASRVPELAGRVEYVDASAVVGNVHEWHGFHYLNGSLLGRMRRFIDMAANDEAANDQQAVAETASR